MIHQCYFKREHQSRLFTAEPYVGFGLEPDVNPSLLLNCPELADPPTRLALCEYGAFLHMWRNPAVDPDEWIGFTSYRQLDKTPFTFTSKRQVRKLIKKHDILAWSVWSVREVKIGALTGAAAQAEIAHPGLHAFTVDVLSHFGILLPDRYQTDLEIPYANYWVLKKRTFGEFMEWSWPIMRYALEVTHPYKVTLPGTPMDNKLKAVGYLMERIFIIWTMRTPLKSKWLGAITWAIPGAAVVKPPWYLFWR